MKKSFSSHIDPFRSSSLNATHKSPPSTIRPAQFQDPCTRTCYYKPSSFNFNSYSQRHSKTMREHANFSKTLIKQERKPASSSIPLSTNNKKTCIQNNVKKNLSSKETNQLSERDLSNHYNADNEERKNVEDQDLKKNKEKSLDLDLEEVFQSPSSLHLKSSSYFKGSKAYTEAMKALQLKVKQLETENLELKRNFVDFQMKIEDLIEQRIAEKSNFFIALENNLKEKIFNLEEQKNSLEKTCSSLKDEISKLQNRLRHFEEKSNLDFKEFIQEKVDLRKHLMSSHEKMKILEEEKRTLIKVKEDILKENKCFSNSISNYENTFHLLQKQNDVLKKELQRSFHKSSKSALEIQSKNNGSDGIKYNLEQREKEIDFLKEKFHEFLMNNDLKILPKESNNNTIMDQQSAQRKKAPGSLKKQKMSEYGLNYENKTLDKMINNIISVNSNSNKQEEGGLKSTKSLHENVFFSNSVESMKKLKPNEDKINESMKYVGTNSDKGSKKSIEDIKKLEKDLSALMDKYSLMSNQICVNFKRNSKFINFFNYL